MDDSRPGTDPMPLRIKELIDEGKDTGLLANEIHRLATVIDSLHQRIATLEKKAGPDLTNL